MHDEAAFLQAMQEHPEDVALRLVFADWLEERGDPRAEMLRLLHTLTQAVKVPQRKRLENRLRKLVASGVKPVGPFITNSIGMKFAWIPAGTFLMGSPEGESVVHEQPQRQVTLTKGFYISVYPVTQASWQEVMGNNPSEFTDADAPVDQVSWDDCQEFFRKLSERDGCSYRLPTEAEWEYGCRACTTTPFSFGKTISTDQVNYADCYSWEREKPGINEARTTPVGSFPPNAWGLHDMHGNVNEWCADWYGECPEGDAVDPLGPADGEDRVLRGGSFTEVASHVRSAYRIPNEPMDRSSVVGFRAVKTFLDECAEREDGSFA